MIWRDLQTSLCPVVVVCTIATAHRIHATLSPATSIVYVFPATTYGVTCPHTTASSVILSHTNVVCSGLGSWYLLLCIHFIAAETVVIPMGTVRCPGLCMHLNIGIWVSTVRRH